MASTNDVDVVTRLRRATPAAATRHPVTTTGPLENRRCRRPDNWAITMNGTFIKSQESPVCRADHPLTSWKSKVTKNITLASAM